MTGNPLDGSRRPGYVGLPFPNTDIRIADPEDPDRTMEDGEPGELLARGPQVFSGYLNNPEGLKAFARERLTRYKVPRDFYHFDKLDRDQTGKIRRREVRDTLVRLVTQP